MEVRGGVLPALTPTRSPTLFDATSALLETDFAVGKPTEFAATNAFACSLFHDFSYFLTLGPLEAPALFVSNLLAPFETTALFRRRLGFTATELPADFLALAAAPFDTFLCHFICPFVKASVYSDAWF